MVIVILSKDLVFSQKMFAVPSQILFILAFSGPNLKEKPITFYLIVILYFERSIIFIFFT